MNINLLLASLGAIVFFVIWELIYLKMKKDEYLRCQSWIDYKLASFYLTGIGLSLSLIFIYLPFAIAMEEGVDWGIFAAIIEGAIALMFLINYLIIRKEKTK